MARNVRSQAPTDKKAAATGKAKKSDSTTKPRNTGPKRRVDWEHNHALIRTVIVEFLARTKRMPHISEISEDSGLAYKTVARHLREGVDLDEIVSGSAVRMLTEDVLTGLARSAIGGNPNAAKLFFEVVHGYVPTARAEVTGANGGPIEIDAISDERRAAAVRGLLESGEEGAAGSDPES